MISIILPLSLLSMVQCYYFPNINKLTGTSIYAKKNDKLVDKPPVVVGKDIPEEITKHNAIYDMILVERYSAPETTAGGLWMPIVEGKDQKHLGYVVSVPLDYGLESEQGRLQPIQEIAPYKAGDTVYIRDPWGIGPKDIKIGERCFSFHRAEHITGLIKKN